MARLNAVSLLDIIGETRSRFEASVITTFNAYFPYYEQIILAHLRKAGCRANTLLMDARQIALEFAEENSKPVAAGREYSLIPVETVGGVFHPKVLLLAGKDKISFCIGSHNATLSGFGKNRELTVWNQITQESTAEQINLFLQVWRSVRAWSDGQPKDLLQGLAFFETVAPWAFEDVRADHITDSRSVSYFSTNENSFSLWNQVKKLLPKKVRRITAIAPFFGNQLSFLEHIRKELSPQEFIVGIEPSAVQIPTNAHLLMPQIKFVSASSLKGGKNYLHAKALLVETLDDKEVLITGSANASRAAWLGTAGKRNFESVMVIKSAPRKTLFKDLGLHKLKNLPALAETDWQNVKPRVKSDDLNPLNNLKILTAIAAAEGFEIVDPSGKLEIASPVALLDKENQVIGQTEALKAENGLYSVRAASPFILQSTNILKFQNSLQENYLAYIHHPNEIARTLRTGKLQELCAQLESFDANINESLIKLIEKFVFDESDLLINFQAAITESFRGAEFRSAKQSNENENVQKEFSLPTAISKNSQFHQNSQTDSLNEILSFINRQLAGNSFPKNLANSFRSEEELIGSEDEMLVKEIDKSDQILSLAALCRRKTKTMMTRMTNKMNAVSTENVAGGYIAFRQLTAVLGFLCLLRHYERNISSLNSNESFIEVNALWKFFFDATYYLYSSPHNILKNARQYAQDNPVVRESDTLWLLVWLACDIEFDINLLTEIKKLNRGETTDDGWEIDQVVRAASRLLLLASDCCRTKESIATLTRFFKDDHEKSWLESHYNWLIKLDLLNRNIGADGTAGKNPQIGDFIRNKAGSVYIVLNNPGHIVVVDINKESEENRFSKDSVQVLNFNP